MTDRGKLITLVAGKCRPLFFTGDDDEVFMTRSLNVTPKTTEEDLIVRSGKSEAYVKIIKKTTPTTDGHKASRGLSATAERLIFK